MLASWHPDTAGLKLADTAGLKLACPRVDTVWEKVAAAGFVKKPKNSIHFGNSMFAIMMLIYDQFYTSC